MSQPVSANVHSFKNAVVVLFGVKQPVNVLLTLVLIVFLIFTSGAIQCVIAFVEFNQVVSAELNQTTQLVNVQFIKHAHLQRFMTHKFVNADAQLFKYADVDSFGVIILVLASSIQELFAYQLFINGVIQSAIAFAELNQIVSATLNL